MRTCAPDTCLSLGGSKREFIFLSRESGVFAPGRGSLEFTETNGDVAERRGGVFGLEERDWRSFSPDRGETVFCQGSKTRNLGFRQK